MACWQLHATTAKLYITVLALTLAVVLKPIHAYMYLQHHEALHVYIQHAEVVALTYLSATFRMCSLVELLCKEYTECVAMLHAAFRNSMSAPLRLVPKGGFMTTVSARKRG